MDKQLASEDSFQRYILGTAGLGGIWGKVNPEQSVQTILEGLKMGITAIDTAPAYGDAEDFVGAALHRWQGPKPSISTKIGRLKGYASDVGNYDYTRSGMETSLRKSLNILGVEVIDTLLLHEPAAIPYGEIDQAVEALVRFKKQGYANRIGLGGNYPLLFKKFIEDNVFDVVMEYNRLNACCLDGLHTSLPECQKQGVDFWAASPLHMGLLGSQFETFVSHCPQWLSIKFIDIARELKAVADAQHLSLPALAFRFLKKIPHSFKIVIGASDNTELQSIKTFIESPALDATGFNQILTIINENNRKYN